MHIRHIFFKKHALAAPELLACSHFSVCALEAKHFSAVCATYSHLCHTLPAFVHNNYTRITLLLAAVIRQGKSVAQCAAIHSCNFALFSAAYTVYGNASGYVGCFSSELWLATNSSAPLWMLFASLVRVARVRIPANPLPM